MSLAEEIRRDVKSIIGDNLVIEEVSVIPNNKDYRLIFEDKGLRFDATVLFIDMRGSTELQHMHNKSTAAKIQMAFYHAITKIANAYGGEVRSFNGDSMLVFFQGTAKETLNIAVQAAMRMKYMLTSSKNGINTLLTKYGPINFGIGIDDGKVLCTKMGISADEINEDLIWVGDPVNKAVMLGDYRRAQKRIGISSYVYDHLANEVKYTITNGYKRDMWTQSTITYNNAYETSYSTSYHWVL